jgi:hypothetical protein
VTEENIDLDVLRASPLLAEKRLQPIADYTNRSVPTPVLETKRTSRELKQKLI